MSNNFFTNNRSKKLSLNRYRGNQIRTGLQTGQSIGSRFKDLIGVQRVLIKYNYYFINSIKTNNKLKLQNIHIFILLKNFFNFFF
jgi:hypothetical protein